MPVMKSSDPKVLEFLKYIGVSTDQLSRCVVTIDGTEGVKVQTTRVMKIIRAKHVTETKNVEAVEAAQE